MTSSVSNISGCQLNHMRCQSHLNECIEITMSTKPNAMHFIGCKFDILHRTQAQTCYTKSRHVYFYFHFYLFIFTYFLPHCACVMYIVYIFFIYISLSQYFVFLYVNINTATQTNTEYTQTHSRRLYIACAPFIFHFCQTKLNRKETYYDLFISVFTFLNPDVLHRKRFIDKNSCVSFVNFVFCARPLEKWK